MKQWGEPRTDDPLMELCETHYQQVCGRKHQIYDLWVITKEMVEIFRITQHQWKCQRGQTQVAHAGEQREESGKKMVMSCTVHHLFVLLV